MQPFFSNEYAELRDLAYNNDFLLICSATNLDCTLNNKILYVNIGFKIMILSLRKSFYCWRFSTISKRKLWGSNWNCIVGYFNCFVIYVHLEYNIFKLYVFYQYTLSNLKAHY